MAANCADTYQTPEQCATACAEFSPMGVNGATDGDTLQCRIYHAGDPASADPATHCPHAGPDGGMVCVDAPQAGTRENPIRLNFDGEGLANADYSTVAQGEEIYFIFTLDAPTDMAIGTYAVGAPDRCAGDSLVDFYLGNGADPSATDDDDGPGLCALLRPLDDPELLMVPAGDHVIGVRSYRGRPSGPNTVFAQRLANRIPADAPCGAPGDERICEFGLRCEDVCTDNVCGDGQASPPEQCDDGNDVDGDGCDSCALVDIAVGAPCDRLGFPCEEGAFCTIEGLCAAHVCGDRVLAPDEECDDGNDVAGDGCEACLIVGIPVGNECSPFGPECEGGTHCGPEQVCVADACGDGAIAPNEECDDGNDVAGDGCEACLIVGIPTGNNCDAFGPDCEAGAHCGPDQLCVVDVCGDGAVAPDEECDDGNDVVGDGCEACVVVGIPLGNACAPNGPSCVDGAICGPDGCIEAGCGNGVREADEQCDDGNADDSDGCTAACLFDPFNGPSEPDSAEAPYVLDFTPDGSARVITELQPAGDNDWFSFVLDADSMVMIETEGYNNPGGCNGDTILTLLGADGQSIDTNDDIRFPNICSRIGPIPLPAGAYTIQLTAFRDGATGANWLRVFRFEALAEGDACDPEAAFTGCPEALNCDLDSLVCAEHRCGDGIVGGVEQCDDGNNDDTDGCAACEFAPSAEGQPCSQAIEPCAADLFCGADQLCAPIVCGDGILSGAEQCDDGNDVEDDGCDSLCGWSPFNGSAEPDAFDAPYLLELDADGRDRVLFEIDPAGERDFFVFELGEPAAVELLTTNLAGDGCNGDTFMTLWGDPNAEPIAVDDDSGPRTCARIRIALEPGIYVAVLRGFDANRTVGINWLQIRTLPLLGEGTDCDPEQDFDTCGAGLGCDIDSASCQLLCGNSVVDPLEECDDGNAINGDGCDACAIVPIAIDAPCAPDSFPCAAGLFCVPAGPDTFVCADSACGDGFANGDEQCDDGNDVLGDGCELCQIVDIPTGNACVDGFACEQGAHCDDAAVAPICVADFCGDGIINGDEMCEDGNDIDGDGCDACQLVDIAVGAECVPGSFPCAPGANCAPGAALDDPATCVEDVCGNGIAEPSEQCDDPNDGCNVACRWEPFNGEFEPDDAQSGYPLDADDRVLFELPAGDMDYFSLTLDAPTSLTVWTSDRAGNNCDGDTIVTVWRGDQQIARNDDGGNRGFCSEIADLPLDAGDYTLRVEGFQGRAAGINWLMTTSQPLIPGDGVCDPAAALDLCAIGFECSVDGTCVALCGNGALEPPEACDDGNDVLGDGCEACQIVPIADGDPCAPDGLPCVDGTVCVDSGAGFACSSDVCGDGVTSGAEQCDDGANGDDTDGCDDQCFYSPFNGAAEPDAIDAAYALQPNDRVLFELPADDMDFFAVTIDVPGFLTVWTSDMAGDGCNGDTILTIWQGQQLARNDDGGGRGFCSEIEGLRVEPGDYVIQTEAFRGNPAGVNWVSTQFQPELPAGEPCDPNAPFDACVVDFLCSVDGICAPACGNGVVDGVEACDDGNDVIGDGCEACFIVPIAIDAACDPAGLPCVDGAQCVDGGNGFVCAGDVCGDAVVGGDEQCDDGVNGDDTDGCDDQCFFSPFNGPAEPDAVDAPWALEGDVLFDLTADDVDYFEITFANPVVLTAWTENLTGDGCTGDTLIEIWNGAVRIADNDDGGPARCSEIADLRLAAGTYQVRTFAFQGRPTGGVNWLRYTVLDILQPDDVCDPNGALDLCPADYACGVDTGTCDLLGIALDGECDPQDNQCRDGNWCIPPVIPDCTTACEATIVCNPQLTMDLCMAQCIANATPAIRYCTVNAACADQLACQQAVTVPAGFCTANVCGDGIVGGDEVCDGGDNCDAACTPVVLAASKAHQQTVNGFVAGEDDRYEFVAKGPVNLRAETSDGQDGCLGDTQIYVWDVSGVDPVEAAFNDDGGFGFCSLLDISLPAGAYEIQVVGYQDRAIPRYTFQFDLVHQIDGPGQYAGGFPVDGNNGFAFSVAAETDVTLFTDDGNGGCPFDTFMGLARITPQGPEPITTDDDGGVRLCSRIAQTLPAGEYEVQVRGFNGAAVPDYTLNIELVSGAPRLVINELDYDNAGADTAEFIEIFNAGDAPADLAGVTLELLDGSGGLLMSYALADSAPALAPGGFFVVGSAAVLANVDAPSLMMADNLLNNVRAGARLLVGDVIVDSVVWEEPIAGFGEGGPTATDAGSADSLGRCLDGVDGDDNTTDFTFGAPTPGALNTCL